MNNNLTPNSKQNDFAVVYTTYVLVDAHIVVGRLQHEGIPAIVDHMAGMNAIGITFGVLGEIRVLVHLWNYERALEILVPENPEQLNPDNHDYILFDEDELDNDE